MDLWRNDACHVAPVPLLLVPFHRSSTILYGTAANLASNSQGPNSETGKTRCVTDPFVACSRVRYARLPTNKRVTLPCTHAHYPAWSRVLWRSLWCYTIPACAGVPSIQAAGIRNTIALNNVVSITRIASVLRRGLFRHFDISYEAIVHAKPGAVLFECVSTTSAIKNYDIDEQYCSVISFDWSNKLSSGSICKSSLTAGRES